MLPLVTDDNHAALPFANGDYLLLPGIRRAVEEKEDEIKAYVLTRDCKETTLHLGALTDEERQIILDGCLINYNRNISGR